MMVQDRRITDCEGANDSVGTESSTDGQNQLENQNRPTIGNGVFALADQVVVSGARFLITVLIAQSCGETELGIYALVMSLVLMVLMVQQTLISTPYANFRNRMDCEAESNYFTSAWNLSVVLSLSVIVVFVLIGAVFWATHHIIGTGAGIPSRFDVLAMGVLAAALAAPFMIASEFFRRTWLIRMQAKQAFVFDAIVAAVTIGSLAVLFQLKVINSQSVFFVLAIIHALAALVALRLLIPRIEFRIDQAIATRKKNWNFGKWIFSSEAVTFGRANLVKWIIGGFLGLGAAGIYSACDSLMRAINPFFLGVASVAEPTLAKGYATGGRREVRRIAYKVLLIMAVGAFPICLGVSLASRQLLLHLYGESFAEYGSVVVWLAGSSFLFSIGYPFANSIQAIDRPEINFRIRAASFVFVVVAALGVTPYLGLWGVAMVQFIGTLISFSLRLLLFNHFFSGSQPLPSKLAGVDQ